jgi:hypothetical protein
MVILFKVYDVDLLPFQFHSLPLRTGEKTAFHPAVELKAQQVRGVDFDHLFDILFRDSGQQKVGSVLNKRPK